MNPPDIAAHRRYLWRVAVLSLVAMTLVCVLNVVVDPHLFFDRPHDPHGFFDARQQKANRIMSTRFQCEFDAVLLGSSRTIQVGDFVHRGQRVLNLSALNLVPVEYGPYLDLYLERCDRAPQKVLLAMDFLGSSTVLFGGREPDVSGYIENARSTRFMLTSLFSMALAKRSIEKLARRFFGSSAYRELPRDHWVFPHREAYAEIYEEYRRNAGYEEVLRALKRKSPESEFIVVTTPVALPLFELMLETGRASDYEHWLRTLVAVFGEVRNGMELNDTTRNPRLFMDENHLWASVGRGYFAEAFLGEPPEAVGGTIVDGEDIDAYLEHRLR